MQPGVYYDISNEDYHSGPGISKSQLDDIAVSPAIFQWRKSAPVDDEKTAALDLGTALHCLLLEPDEFSKRFMIGPEVNRRTTAGKQKEQDFLDMCEQQGITPITHDDNRKLRLMRDSAFAHPVARWMLETEGKAEASIYWNDRDTQVLSRCRPDKLIAEFNWCVDVKSTADIGKFQKDFYSYRYHVQDAFYSDGYDAQFCEVPTFAFLVVSSSIDCGRYPVQVFIMDQQAKDAGRAEYKRNLTTYSDCLARNEWPGIATLSLPYWAKEIRNV